MIPSLVMLSGGSALVLPPGVHWATLQEVEAAFATTPHRAALFEGIVRVAAALRLAGCKAMYLDGSFTTSKDAPSDFDGCWDARGVVGARLDPVLLDFTNKRAAQKKKFGGEMFIATANSGNGATFLDFFQEDKDTGLPKGIVGIVL